MSWLDLKAEIAEEMGGLVVFDRRVLGDGFLSIHTHTKAARRALGLCVDCAGPSTGTRRCAWCSAASRKHQSSYRQRTYQPRPRKPAMPPEERARLHRVRNAAYMHARHRRVGAGEFVCPRCSRACAPGRRQCSTCLDADRQRKRNAKLSVVSHPHSDALESAPVSRRSA